jgi:predicted phosphodiesterase
VRILVLSDLHLEFRRGYEVPQDVEFDVVVLAGDIHRPGAEAIAWAQRSFQTPVIFVPGNHEYYGAELRSELEAMRGAAAGSHVHVLHQGVAQIDGVTFIGCTLWADFAIPIGNEPEPISYFEESNIERALATANKYLADFTSIKIADPSIPRSSREEIKQRWLTAEDELAMHWVERDWLRRHVEYTSGTTVVVTHHAPHRRSVAPKYRSDWVTPAFVTDLPSAFFAGTDTYLLGEQQRAGPNLWVHGHTHTSFDYQVSGCRVVSNPRGYFQRDGSWENAGFDPAFVVEV